MAKFELNHAERESGGWKKVEEFLLAEQQDLRKKNDTPQPHDETTLNRGELRLIRKMLDAVKERPESRPTSVLPHG